MALNESDMEFVKELKGCPLCGESGRLVEYETRNDYRGDQFAARVHCKTCGCNTGWINNCCFGATIEWETKVHWNNRAGAVRYGIY